MTDFFKNGVSVEIPVVLANRDHRVTVQQAILSQHPRSVVVAAKLNIPGPVKNNQAIQDFFCNELAEFESRLIDAGVLFTQQTEWVAAKTGPERFYLVLAGGPQVKQLAVAFEESRPSRRLFDLDVIYRHNGQAVAISRTELGLPVRKCLLCQRPAKDCGRSRRHSVAQLQNKVASLITTALTTIGRQQLSAQLATLAVKALLAEVTAWPKPGLVDPVEHGAHPDENHFTFIDSACSLESYFHRCAQVGANYEGTDDPQMFAEIRQAGQTAEQTMFAATDGQNTHKGAIFSLGILTCAAANCWPGDPNQLFSRIQSKVRGMLTGLIAGDLQHLSMDSATTAGEHEYLQYGLTGARGEAAAGFPTVFNVGIPAYQQASGSINDKIVETLLRIARQATDSNLIKRAGTPQIVDWKNDQIDHCLALGSLTTSEGRQAVTELQTEFTKRHLSLGGSADLLIDTLFLVMVMETKQNGRLHK